MRTIGAWLLLFASPSILSGQQRHAATPDTPRPPPPVAMTQDQPPLVTRHQVPVRGNVLRYTVTTGYMPVKNAQGTIEGQMFFMAYSLDGAEPGSRPLMFSFNG